MKAISLITILTLFSFDILFPQKIQEYSALKYFEDGLTFMQEEKYLEAIGAFTYAISLKPTYAKAFYERGKAKNELLGQNIDGYLASMEDFASAIQMGETAAIAEVYETGHQICYGFDNGPEESPVYCIDFSNLGLEGSCGINHKIPNVMIANFWNNGISQLNEIIETMPNLISLDIGKNKIARLPKDIQSLKYLYNLNLSHNQLHTLPPSLNNLKHLRMLNLRGNQLNDLEVLSDNAAIEVLDLSLNQLTTIPKAVFSMRNLKELDLSGNQIPFNEISEAESRLPTTQIIY